MCLFEWQHLVALGGGDSLAAPALALPDRPAGAGAARRLGGAPASLGGGDTSARGRRPCGGHWQQHVVLPHGPLHADACLPPVDLELPQSLAVPALDCRREGVVPADLVVTPQPASAESRDLLFSDLEESCSSLFFRGTYPPPRISLQGL
eukprot:gene3252-biopygen657